MRRARLVLLATLGSVLAATPALAIKRLPPSEVYVPGNEKKFQEGVNAFDAKAYTRAYKIFSELAAHDDIAARRNKALMERKGLGTPKNYKAAIADYTIAAEDGLPTACADLGQMLLLGEGGKPDPDAALPWLVKAAAASHPVAQFLLGWMYEHGEAVDKDREQAIILYKAAAAHGSKRAAERLAVLTGPASSGAGKADGPTADAAKAP